MRYTITFKSKKYNRQSLLANIVGDHHGDEILLFITKHDIEHASKHIIPHLTYVSDDSRTWSIQDYFYEPTRPKYLHVKVKEVI